MKVVRTLTIPLLAVAFLAGCGDGTGPDEDPIAPFVGTWTATVFSYTAHEGEASVDLVKYGGEDAFTVTVTDEGSFTADLLMPDMEDPENGQATLIELAGALELQAGDELLIDFDEASQAYFMDRTVTYSFEDDGVADLVWVDDGATFDFDQDGQEDAATLRVELVKE